MKYLLGILFLLFVAPLNSHAQPIEWPVSEGGNGHFYELVQHEMGAEAIWWDGMQSAMGQTHNGFQGHLATITSSEENDWIIENIFVPSQLTNCVFYTGGWNDGFVGYPDGLVNYPIGDWHWVTGEEWNYTNWASDQPTIGGISAEFALSFFYLYAEEIGWNDLRFSYYGPNIYSGHVVEYDDLPVVNLPPPGGMVAIESSTWGSVKALFR